MAKNTNTTRVNFNLNNDLITKVDDFAAENGINRTAAFSVIISTYFRQDDAIKTIQDAMTLVKQGQVQE